jgi:hypothetical protein
LGQIGENMGGFRENVRGFWESFLGFLRFLRFFAFFGGLDL